MSVTIAIALFSMQLVTPVNAAAKTDTVGVHYEEIDFLLSSGTIALGLVTCRKYPDYFCVGLRDVKNQLGFNTSLSDDACLNLVELDSKHGIPLSVDRANMALLLPPEYMYPAKAYREARRRINAYQYTTPKPIVSVAPFNPSLWVDVKRFDLALRNSGDAISAPEVHSTLAGDVLGGTFKARGTTWHRTGDRSYTLQPIDYSWTSGPHLRHSWIPRIDLGSRVYDSDYRYVVSGVTLTNKPKSSRDVQFTDGLQLYASPGSIVEWHHHAGERGQSVVDQSGSLWIETPINYGLNRISYALTEPGALTTYGERWIRVPTSMIPARAVEYQLVLGKPTRLWDDWLSYGKVEYGVGNRLSVAMHQTSVFSRDRKRHQVGTEFVYRPTFNSEMYGHFNSDAEYALRATYWNPSIASVELFDLRKTSNAIMQNRFDSRSTLIRANIHGLRRLRAQTSFHRTSYGSSTTSSLNGTFTVNNNHWIVATNVGHQWWSNNGSMNLHRSSASAHTSRRISHKLMLTSDVYVLMRDHIQVESVKLSAYYNTTTLQLGANIAIHAPEMVRSIGFTARVRSDWFNIHTMHEIQDQGYYSSQAFTTAWMKAGRGDWHAVSQTSDQSSGLLLMPFLDANGNGKKDTGEQILTGLMGTIREGRLISSEKNNHQLIFAELQPHRTYMVTLSADLRNDPEYLVSETRLSVDTPGSGYRTIHVPVSRSFELTGLWESDNGDQVQPGRTKLVLTKIDGNTNITGTLFGDGTWIVDKISPGSYAITVSDSENKNMVAYPTTIRIASSQELSSRMIIIRNKG